MTITLNGQKHDEYRRTINNEGSMRLIMDNLTNIRNCFPDVWEKQIHFIANILSAQELPGLREFYAQEIGKQPKMISNINFDYCNNEVKKQFKKDIALDRDVSEKLQSEYIQSNDSFLKALYDEGIDMIHNRGLCDETASGLISSCMPMSWRLFVRTDGTFNMCEKVSDGLCLGNLEDGFDEKQIKKLYKQMNDFAERNCKTCWAQRLCMYCYQDIVNEKGEISDYFESEWCEQSQEKILQYLKMYIQVVNSNPEKLLKFEITKNT